LWVPVGIGGARTVRVEGGYNDDRKDILKKWEQYEQGK